jgi:hypothetical protein
MLNQINEPRVGFEAKTDAIEQLLRARARDVKLDRKLVIEVHRRFFSSASSSAVEKDERPPDHPSLVPAGKYSSDEHTT